MVRGALGSASCAESYKVCGCKGDPDVRATLRIRDPSSVQSKPLQSDPTLPRKFLYLLPEPAIFSALLKNCVSRISTSLHMEF